MMVGLMSANAVALCVVDDAECGECRGRVHLVVAWATLCAVETSDCRSSVAFMGASASLGNCSKCNAHQAGIRRGLKRESNSTQICEISARLKKRTNLDGEMNGTNLSEAVGEHLTCWTRECIG